MLALQGAFDAHVRALTRLGTDTALVRTVADLDVVDALVMPGGESTTMSKLLLSSGLFDSISERIDAGMAVFGTCAGMILLAREVRDGRPDQRCLAAIDIVVQRNGYGRQVDSFEADLELGAKAAVTPSAFHAVFIRAPRVLQAGRSVEVIASHQGDPVLLRDRAIFVASFHPELTGDDRIHSMFLQEVA